MGGSYFCEGIGGGAEGSTAMSLDGPVGNLAMLDRWVGGRRCQVLKRRQAPRDGVLWNAILGRILLTGAILVRRFRLVAFAVLGVCCSLTGWRKGRSGTKFPVR